MVVFRVRFRCAVVLLVAGRALVVGLERLQILRLHEFGDRLVYLCRIRFHAILQARDAFVNHPLSFQG